VELADWEKDDLTPDFQRNAKQLAVLFDFPGHYILTKPATSADGTPLLSRIGCWMMTSRHLGGVLCFVISRFARARCC
jgi:hypothetical protein